MWVPNILVSERLKIFMIHLVCNLIGLGQERILTKDPFTRLLINIDQSFP